MKTKIALSLLVILFVVAASLGATFAWFTDSVVLDNTFTAGTLSIDGSDYWTGYEEGDAWENVNPGDCKDKEFTITNDGTKNVLIRLQFDGSWGEWVAGADGPEWVTNNALDETLVTVSAPTGWTEHTDGWYYYDSRLLPPDHNDYEPLEFTLTVCVDGPGTDNNYQGESYKLGFTFEAIQASNNASGSEWLVNSLYYLNGTPTLKTDPATENMTADNWAGFGY